MSLAFTRRAAALGLAAALMLVAFPAAAASQKLRYSISLGILPVFGLDVEVDAQNGEWTISTLMAAVPAFSRLYPGRITAAANGNARGGIVRPAAYRHAIAEVERPVSVRLGFDAAGREGWIARRVLPELRADEPRLPPERLTGALDPLAAFMAVMTEAQRAKVCPPRLKLFDGYRVLEIAVETAGEQVPPRAAGGGISVGRALACRFALVGSSEGSARDYSSYLNTGTVWLATIAGNDGLPVPVRVEAGSGPTQASMTLISFSSGR